MSAFEAVAHFFSPTTSLIKRIINFVIITTIILTIDNQMGFSYHYFTQKKIDEISGYNKILLDTTIDAQTKILIKNQRRYIIDKERFYRPINKKDKHYSPLFYISYSFIMVLLIFSSPYFIRKGNLYITKGIKISDCYRNCCFGYRISNYTFHICFFIKLLKTAASLCCQFTIATIFPCRNFLACQ